MHTNQDVSPPQGSIGLDSKARWGQDRRLAFIDFRLQFERRLNRADLSTFFGVSTPQASQDLARYAQLAPENLHYDASAKVFVPGKNFTPKYGNDDAGPYLRDIQALATGVIPNDASFIGWMPPVGIVPTIKRPMTADLLATVLGAMRGRRALKINYQSMSREQPSTRDISPVALGNDGFRWHIRAFCHLRGHFADFVFGRILHTEASEAPAVDPDQDIEWHQQIALELAPNPKLSPAQQLAIALDYGMEEGHVRVETRQALLFYALRRLGLNRHGEFENGGAQHIVLTNRADLAAYLSADTAE